jgi:hypothetical protein
MRRRAGPRSLSGHGHGSFSGVIPGRAKREPGIQAAELMARNSAYGKAALDSGFRLRRRRNDGTTNPAIDE